MSDHVTPEGHPPITPLNFEIRPELVERYLPQELAGLYRIIYEGTLACLAEPPLLEHIRVQLQAEGSDLYLEAEAVRELDPGWLEFNAQRRRELIQDGQAEALLTAVESNHPLTVVETVAEPSKERIFPHTISSLMRLMESLQIARPSTYGSIFEKLKEKKYVTINQGYIQLTERGRRIYQAICRFKPIIADPGFTLELEQALGAIARGEESSLAVLQCFWSRIDPQSRYQSQQNSSVPSLGERIKAKSASTQPVVGPPLDNHPLHQADKAIKRAFDDCKCELEQLVAGDWAYLPDPVKVLRLWFLSYLYGLDMSPVATLDRLMFDRSFRWFMSLPEDAMVWSLSVYQRAIGQLSLTGIIPALLAKIDWTALEEPSCAEIFVGISRLKRGK